MALEPSILKSTKKILGLVEDETPFDQDVTTHINSAFAIINDIGIGPSNGFFIEDDSANWEDIGLPAQELMYVKQFVQLHARMLFDPPATSFHIQAITDARDEFLIRLSYIRENGLTDDDSPSGNSAESASGTQSSPASIWIMTHNLGFNPAGFRFTSLDGLTELEPEQITYVSVNQALAIWPSAISGIWTVS